MHGGDDPPVVTRNTGCVERRTRQARLLAGRACLLPSTLGKEGLFARLEKSHGGLSGRQ